MTGYVRNFDVNVTMFFKTGDKKLLKKYNQMQKRIDSNKLEIKFDSKPVYDDDNKYVKTKIKIYNDNMITNSQGKKCQRKNHHASVYQ